MGERPQNDAHWRELLAQQVRQNARLWFRLAYDILHDAHAAEDACQQSLMRAWSNRDRLRDPMQLRSWLAKTVINESLTVLRRNRTEQRVLDNEPRLQPQHTVLDDSLTARETIMAGLAALSEPVRAVVALRIMQGFSGNEVKDLLGCSASQVSRMLHEGLEQLRTTLNPKLGDAEKAGSHDVR